MPVNFDASVANINVGDLGADPQFVQHLMNAQNKLSPFGKAWDVGSQSTVFYPYKLVPARDDPNKNIWVPCLSALYGHQVGDWKLFGRGFIVSRCALTANAEVIGEGDMAYQFSRLCPLLVEAQKEKELADCAAKDWSMLGQSAYQTARQEIENRYDRKNNMNAVKPLLSRLSIQMNTVVFCVAMNPATSSPIWDTASDSKSKTGLFVQTLSSARRTKLDALANNPLMGINAQYPDKEFQVGDVAFLEVMYNFTSSRMARAEAGRADPQGVAHSLSLRQRFPDGVSKIESYLSQVPTKPDEIRAKLYKMEPMSDDELRLKFQQYTLNTATNWGFLSPEDQDRLINCANIIDYLRIQPADLELKKALEERLGHPIGRAPRGSAPTIDNLVGNDAEFDTGLQKDAVSAAVSEAEQNIGEEFALAAGSVEV